MALPASIPALLGAVRAARLNPRITFSVPDNFPIDGAQVLALWARGVDRRASRGLAPLSERGERRFIDLQWDAMQVNDYARGLRHSGCRNLLRDPSMKARYPHIDNQSWDGFE